MSAENVILVTIRDKVATADKTVYVCGNSGFTVNFDFDSEWDELEVKTARFICDDASYVDVLFSGTVCPVPVLSNTHRVRVGVYAGNLVTTTPAYITASKSILCDGGTPADPPDDVYNQLMEKLNGFDEELLAGVEADIEVLTEEDIAIKGRLAKVEKWIDDKDYGDGILINSFSHDAGTREMGSTITSINLNWSLNRKPVTQTLNGEELGVDVRKQYVDGLNVTMDRNTWPSWKLTVTDTRNKVVSGTVSGFTFLNGVYWGVAAQPEAINSQFVLGLTKKLSSSKVSSFTVNAGAGQHIWYCLPVRLGTCTFKVGGFEGGFTLVDTISFTNDTEGKYTERYYIYRSDESNLGSTTVGVS